MKRPDMLDYDGRLVIITIDGDINIQNRAGLVDHYMTLSRVYSLASFMPGWSGEFESTTLYGKDGNVDLRLVF